MGRSSNPNRYPSYFCDILLQLTKHPQEPVVIPCSTKSELMQLRVNFMAFKSACLKENWHKPGAVIRAPGLAGFTTKQRNNPDGTYTLEIWDNEYLPENVKHREAVNKQLDPDFKFDSEN